MLRNDACPSTLENALAQMVQSSLTLLSAPGMSPWPWMEACANPTLKSGPPLAYGGQGSVAECSTPCLALRLLVTGQVPGAFPTLLREISREPSSLIPLPSMFAQSKSSFLDCVSPITSRIPLRAPHLPEDTTPTSTIPSELGFGHLHSLY